MKHLLPLAASIALVLAAPVLRAETEFPLTEDSKPHDDVPKGELIKFQFDGSKIFPGTTREVKARGANAFAEPIKPKPPGL